MTDETDFERVRDLVDRTLKNSSVDTVRWVVKAGNIEEFNFVKMTNITDFENVIEVDFRPKPTEPAE